MTEDTERARIKWCTKSVTDDGWHFSQCCRPAKWTVLLESGERLYFCGQHKPRKRFAGKLEPVHKETT